VKERPLLFRDEMVRAILEGRKTQTRRTVNGSPVFVTQFIGRDSLPTGEYGWHGEYDRVITKHIRCPYGAVGDRLWVRECWRVFGGREYEYQMDRRCVVYRAGGPPPDVSMTMELVRAEEGPQEWRPSIFMPRWASRITLEITNVRVQRLQDIEPDDAQAEGIIYEDEHPHDVRRIERCPLVDGYMRLWDRINGDGSWDANPWVWALTFKRIDEATADKIPREQQRTQRDEGQAP
jgi:hypothetical protein